MRPPYSGAEEAVEEARPGIRRNKNALTGCKPRTDQAASDDLGALANFAPREAERISPGHYKATPVSPLAA